MSMEDLFGSVTQRKNRSRAWPAWEAKEEFILRRRSRVKKGMCQATMETPQIAIGVEYSSAQDRMEGVQSVRAPPEGR